MSQGIRHIILGACISLLSIGFFLTVLTAGFAIYHFQTPGPLKHPILFEVTRGQNVEIIAKNLKEKGVIECPILFKISARLLDTAHTLKAGEYKIPAQISIAKMITLLRDGTTYHRQFTIPEGLTSYEIIRLLNNTPHLSGEILNIPPEGSLLPETYDYRKSEDRNKIVRRLQDNMQKTLDALWETRADNLPITTKEEALILASIVEKETGTPEERARVAGVFINRLRINMALQTDPTVIYAITMGKHENKGKGPLGRRLLKKDLAYDSPYNTYLYPGLTPGPIANPGRAAIAATLNPETHDYLYFVADGTGGHAFAKTLDEHNKNVTRWRSIRSKQ